MLVQELFTRLSYGELSSLAIGMEGAGSIASDREDQVLSSTTLALTALYSRFQLRVSYLTLQATLGVSTYVLDREHAESNTTPPHTTPRYIRDVTLMPAPYPGDLIRILEVNPVVLGLGGVPINSRRAEWRTAKIVAFNELLLLRAEPGELFEVEYQADHPELLLAGEISIMPALEEALQARTAAAIFSGMAGEAHVARAAEHMARYETLCSAVKLDDMAQESSSDDFDRLRDKGFD